MIFTVAGVNNFCFGTTIIGIVKIAFVVQNFRMIYDNALPFRHGKGKGNVSGHILSEIQYRFSLWCMNHFHWFKGLMLANNFAFLRNQNALWMVNHFYCMSLAFKGFIVHITMIYIAGTPFGFFYLPVFIGNKKLLFSVLVFQQ